jgi:hypothetical protein
MRCHLRKVTGPLNFDVLPVIKLECSPAVPILQRIYAQAQLACTDTDLITRLAAFESNPSQDSRFEIVFAGPAGRIFVKVDAQGFASLMTPAGERTSLLRTRCIAGEDLQGVFWGVVLEIPLSLLYGNAAIDASASDVIFKETSIKKARGAVRHFYRTTAPKKT